MNKIFTVLSNENVITHLLKYTSALDDKSDTYSSSEKGK